MYSIERWRWCPAGRSISTRDSSRGVQCSHLFHRCTLPHSFCRVRLRRCSDTPLFSSRTGTHDDDDHLRQLSTVTRFRNSKTVVAYVTCDETKKAPTAAVTGRETKWTAWEVGRLAERRTRVRRSVGHSADDVSVLVRTCSQADAAVMVSQSTDVIRYNCLGSAADIKSRKQQSDAAALQLNRSARTISACTFDSR